MSTGAAGSLITPPESWGYAPAAGRFDEAFIKEGEVRPHFSGLFDALRPLSRDELDRRWSQAQRVIREHGVTYNVYGDPRGADRPWQLDPLPMVLSAEEWSRLEAGLTQRARLLDAVLADLYGPQRLLKDGLLPPELVLGNPAFLRPLHGVPVPRNIRLQNYAADLSRGSDGRFWVFGDRTQAPSGAGYALENRIVISRLLPQAFRDCRVERLAPFFRAYRDGLMKLAQRRTDNPRIVLLTPGPYNETYFEHAYLARYLGFTLVEGGDLTVRDRVVHLKTLGGLERVDVIVRRLDDSYADPLSLRPDSSLGVAGLVHAVRAGNVSIATPLGSGLLETPALSAFLPKIAKAWLGEELLVPTVPTYFCGDPNSLPYVLDRLETLVLKSSQLGPGLREPVFGGDLSPTELAELSSRIRARPSAYVAQECLPLSTAPALTTSGIRPRSLSLRTFLTRRDDNYVLMQGALTRIASSSESRVVSMQKGGGSKDTWVLAQGEPSSFTLLPPPDVRVEVVRSGADLPSRVADNLFWIGRYVERAEVTTRLFRSLLARRGDDALGRAPEVSPLLSTLEDELELIRGMLTRSGTQLDAELLRLLLADQPPRTPAAGILSGYRAASAARDRISMDTWRVLSQLSATVEQARQRGVSELSDGLEIVGSLMLGFSAFSGLVMENMTHGPGWRFLDIGRRIERGSFMVRLLRATLVPAAHDAAVLDAALEVADSAMTYRSRYLGTLSMEPLLDLLLTDETNPRSLAYQLAAIEGHVAKLPRSGRPLLTAEAKTVVRALSLVRLSELEKLARVDPQTHQRVALSDLLAQLELALPVLADQLTLGYLAHAQPSFSLGSLAERVGSQELGVSNERSELAQRAGAEQV
ncbi:MAG TPA: circularly permuted type 2 ATP-grasp protein [Polyangiaceae bacterium]|nr:circularly permuted type 2 ATP-grasp protein [Polyangiaceae bacterium]